jgi:hypothetical protein
MVLRVKIRDVQLDLKVLWVDTYGKMPTPQEIKGFRKRVAHRLKMSEQTVMWALLLQISG